MRTPSWLAGILALLLCGCGADGAHDEHAAHARHTMLAGEKPLAGSSIYQLEGAWTDAGGEALELSELRGQPVLALMFYGTCEHACPVLVHDLQNIEARLEGTARDRTRFLLVSFDPETDTPAKLAKYAQERGLDPQRWRLLHGDAEQVRALALVLGVRYRPTGDGAFSHTSRITLLDREGVFVAHVDGLGQDPQPLLDPLLALLTHSADSGKR